MTHGVIEPPEQVRLDWQKTRFVEVIADDDAKGWLLQTMQCIDQIGRRRFALKDVYAFENKLRNTHPDNGHIKEKLRQLLQLLRDQGYLKFVGRGVYEL